MPIQDRSYRAYEGELHRGLAWWVIARQELRVLFATRFFFWLTLLGGIHFAARVVQVIGCDILAANPNTPLSEALKGMRDLSAFWVVDERLFFQFLEGQSSILFWILLFAGSGMICEDIRYNLMEVYFSKPITWRDYALGKIMALVLVGLLLTAVPGLILVTLHNFLSPGWETLRTSYWWPGSILIFSIALVVPCSLFILAGSALFRSQRVAGIAVFILLMADLSLANILSDDLLNNSNFSLIGAPFAIGHLGESLFHQNHSLINLGWTWSLSVILCVSGIFLGVICRQVYRCEAAG